MSERLGLQIDDGIAEVMLNRADKRNALDMAMFEALIETGDSLKDMPSLRAVVLHGAGEHFCAGIDVSVFSGEGIAAAGEGLMQPRPGSAANLFQSAAWVWQEIPVPVIAALHGVVFGGGLQVALGADIRYATPDAQLSIMEIKWGLIPDMAISSTARRVVPPDRLKELAYTGRIVSGQEALVIGLVTDVAEQPLDAARQIATDIAGRSPDAIRAIKSLLRDTWQSDAPASLHREAELQSAVMRGDNQAEAVLANLEKRRPRFVDPGQ
ncbi:MAG: crotonase/enoyl-CoA hydratase family protein [Woeseiaceae bacterium]|nr:crotonase/enoyl-CoA hydratase family protein [Woeseiaceae bacterium]